MSQCERVAQVGCCRVAAAIEGNGESGGGWGAGINHLNMWARYTRSSGWCSGSSSALQDSPKMRRGTAASGRAAVNRMSSRGELGFLILLQPRQAEAGHGGTGGGDKGKGRGKVGEWQMRCW